MEKIINDVYALLNEEKLNGLKKVSEQGNEESFPEQQEGQEDTGDLEKTFPEMSLDELREVLGLIVKKDDTNKVVTALGMLLAYTENSQVNVSFNGPSCTGKSYIPLETVKVFPETDVIKIGYCSPTAFFHDKGDYVEEGDYTRIDLSRKILIFIDQPHTELLNRLRPLLSHDEKEIRIKITDRSKSGSNRTKNIVIVGFPVVIFCTAGLRMDEQEITRMLLLSPEIAVEKIMSGIEYSLDKAVNMDFADGIEQDSRLQSLKKRIVAIKEKHFTDVIIKDPIPLMGYYDAKKAKDFLIPSDMRNIKKMLSLIKAIALLNFSHRETRGRYLVASQQDVAVGMELWEKISVYQELSLPPFILWFYRDVFLPAYEQKNKKSSTREGLKKQDILRFQQKRYSSMVSEDRLRKEIIPCLKNASLINEAKDPGDGREKVYFPVEEVEQL